MADTESRLLSALEKIGARRVLCVGDLMLDRFVYGQVERISPEAPIPVLHVQRKMSCLGGSGNVVRNIQALGGQVEFIAVVGNDAAGHEILRQFAGMEGITPFLQIDSARPTTVKVRYVSAGQQLLRVDEEEGGALSPGIEEAILSALAQAVPKADIVVLSDYKKGVLSDRVTRAAIELAREHRRKILIDPKSRDYGHYRGASYLTPNRKELGQAAGRKIGSVEETETAARQLIEAHDLEGVIAKMGGEGICLVQKGKKALHFHKEAREVYDVSGAGDTVIATLAMALAEGLDVELAADLANLAGSLVVGKAGTATITREDLAHELLREQSDTSHTKILMRHQAAEYADRWRRQGLKVGFTNGCFDLLHPGHISLLRQARGACDKLFVGLNSDSSVKRLKGESRPLQGEAARAEVLASLMHVDHVVIFDEPTPIDLIEAIRPDFLVKGADYTVDKVVGADRVKRWGGQVILADLVEGQSTTATIARLKA